MLKVIADHDLVVISKKKPSYPVSEMLREYLGLYDRAHGIPLSYDELFVSAEMIPVYDREGRETHWYTMLYPRSYRDELDEKLKVVYSHLSTAGDMRAIKHLFIDRIDYCEFGNSKPFRIRVVNRYNDNQDYFYVKRADASRIYGLELEHILSPNRINILVFEDTLIEEHIAGVPGDVFLKDYLPAPESPDNLASAKFPNFVNPIRVCKEFVKFNERCFAKLLGDMRSYNYVVVITQDFDERQYRVRAIDFDRQCHEGNLKVYLPQFYKENQPVVSMVWNLLTPDTIRQYQKEERALMRRRAEDDEGRLSDLFSAMVSDSIAPEDNTRKLALQLARFHKKDVLAGISNMGELTREHFLYTIDD